MVLLLTPNDVKGLVTMKEAAEAMEQGFLDWARNRWLGELRQRVHSEDNVRLTVHIGAPSTAATIGVYVHPEKVVIHQNDVQSYATRGARVRIVYDSREGELLSIQIGEMEVTELPGVNNVVVVPTSCAAAVGTKWLARKDSRRVGILGSRGQAKGHLAACKALIPTLETAVVYSPNPDHRAAFAAQMSEALDMDVTAGARAEDALEGVDILLTVTNSNVPTFDGNLLEPGTHVTTVVSSNKGLHERGFITRPRREIDDATLQRADIVVCNNIEQEKLDHTAVLWRTCEDGVIPWSKVWDIGQVMSGEVPGRTSDEQISVYKQNAFWGVGDQAIGRLLYERAKAEGRGIALDVDGFESRIDSREEP